MQLLQHQRPTIDELLASFPTSRYPRMWKSQREALTDLAENDSVTLELPTGSGKTVIGYTFLIAHGRMGQQPLFLITPNKTLVDQIVREYPDLRVAYGRNDHECLYYTEPFKADEIPCSLLKNCPHRVDQLTGKTHEEGAVPCPYLKQKYEAKQGGIVVCTTAFYLFTQLFSKEWETPAALVIDEAHQLAKVVRNALSYEITDYHLRHCIDLLSEVAPEQSAELGLFLRRMIYFIKRKPAHQSTLLEDEELKELMDIIERINPRELASNVEKAVNSGQIDVVAERESLRKLEVLVRDLHRYWRSFQYSLNTAERHPLSYTYAYWKEEKGENDRVQYRMVVKSYHVSALIKKMLSPRTLSMSATIGDPEIFGFETGIVSPFKSYGSNFPVKNARVYLPTDTPNLAMNSRNRQDLTKTLRKIARACYRLRQKGYRSLVVVVSNAELDKFKMLAAEENVEAITYGNGVPPKVAAAKFKSGEGDVLVGTVANYGEGVDLPREIAPVIFFLRPGYPNPKDPATIFEERRFGGMRWALWNWRMMLEALQVRGRNIRNHADRGVTIFMSQQFRRFLRPALPGWLQDAYEGGLSFEQCLDETEKLLND